MSDIQLDYTSRDFESIKKDLITLINYQTGDTWDLTEPSDLGAILIEAFAYMGDMISYYIDRIANETSVTTATKQSNLLQFGNLYGYKPSGPTSAYVDITFQNISSYNIDIPIGTQVIAPVNHGTYSEVYFETISSAVGVLPSQTITLTCVEGKTVNTDRPDLIDSATNKALPSAIGTSTGSANQELQIFEVNIVDSSLTVYVGQGLAFTPWQYVDSLLDHGPAETVFTTQLQNDGSLLVLFGDGINGAIPAANALISATYRTSVGLAGNILPGTVAEVTFIPGNIDPEAITFLTATNISAGYGGANSDDLTQLRKKIIAAISTKNRAITLKDYENLALMVPQVGKVRASAEIYSNVTLYLQTQNDNSATPGIIGGLPTNSWDNVAAAVATYVGDKIPAGASLNVIHPTYVPIYVAFDLTVNDAYKQNNVRLAVYQALIGSNGYFTYEKNTFGRTVSLSNLIGAIINIPGVNDITVTDFNSISSGAGVVGFDLNDNEIPYLVPGNILITPFGGIV